ncbi:metal-dependent hydrolase [Proteobacteria bacterium 005FR1]|nr:metal-dependent hydrolase [Proteobacteria bacterium 005FR1]
MDPVTQGALGAAFAQTAARARSTGTKHLWKAAVVGALAGMAPDLDVLIRSSDDPLLFLEYHRQFTHSLFFIPIGGLLCGLLFFWLFGRRWQMKIGQCALWATIGYATHGLLDACTSYGTLLLWPFSDHRFSWDIVSVVDPLFTLPLLAFVITAGITKLRRYAWLGIGWAGLYLLLGYIQHERAVVIAHQLADSRGHDVRRLEAKPSFANILVWKSIYETDGQFFVDAIKVGVFDSHIWRGESIRRLDVSRDFPWLEPESQQARDIKRFDWFSAGFTAVDPDDPTRIIDIRYSMLPQEINALWGIELSKGAGPREHADYFTAREGGAEAGRELWNMITK